MKKLKLLILEDQTQEAEEIQLFLKDNNYDVIVSKNIQEAKQEIQNHFFDMIVLDILINGKPEGIHFAQYLNKQGINIPFLFLTNLQSKLIFDQAKLTNPFIYLLKPYNELELLFSLELAIESHYEQSNTISFNSENAVLSPIFFFIKKKKSVVKVAVQSISYIEVKEKYCNLKCDKEHYQIKLSLTRIKEILSNPDFKQVHRNYLVNIKKIKEIYFEDNLILLDSNDKISFSERYKNLFVKDNIIFR
ncbi:LytR/AlgR family response regulator transcription factor [Aquimarina muelleri]|nr:LytTR family transcriptional regulator DNA-binding domain-containing protein [Aquimarina muelleri]MCX2763680.1 DNA-binding response regulator [Aquimarina muelleri]